MQLLSCKTGGFQPFFPDEQEISHLRQPCDGPGYRIRQHQTEEGMVLLDGKHGVDPENSEGAHTHHSDQHGLHRVTHTSHGHGKIGQQAKENIRSAEAGQTDDAIGNGFLRIGDVKGQQGIAGQINQNTQRDAHGDGKGYAS